MRPLVSTAVLLTLLFVLLSMRLCGVCAKWAGIILGFR